MELVAPAGGWEAFIAAIQVGADAVYLGGRRFSARSYAVNFSDEEIAAAVEYAHIHGTRVYLALNTLLTDGEITEALESIATLNRAGVDAVIIQDLGLLGALRTVMPEVEVHASTQMTVHNTPQARLAGELGCSRVVLARELSLPEIETIAENSGLEVEVFVHGALCFSYSGQCLFSSLIGGRSGNRGACAQPCRKRYRVVVTSPANEVIEVVEDGFALSCRDLNAISLLPRLAEAGVSALKVEGRMKRPEYVATVVSVYRRYLDKLAASQAGGEEAVFAVAAEDAYKLEQIFNRGFTTAYLERDPGRDLISPRGPANQGVYLGEVIRVAAGKAVICLAREISLGDGIEYPGKGGTVVPFIRVDGRPVSTAAAGETVELSARPGVKPGDEVYKTSSRTLLEEARGFVEERKRFIPLKATVEAYLGKPLRITFVDSLGNKGEAETTPVVEKARKHPLTEKVIREKVGRIGDTPYQITAWEIHLDDGIMAPFSAINDTRRQALENLQRARLERLRPPSVGEAWRERFHSLRSRVEAPQGAVPKGLPARPRLAVRVDSSGGAEEAGRTGADIIYIEVASPKREPGLTDREWEEIYSLVGEEKGQGSNPFPEVIPSFPRIIKDTDFPHWVRVLENLSRRGAQRVMVGNLGLVEAARRLGFAVVCDFPVNVFNSYSLHLLSHFAVERATLSPELSLNGIKKLTPPVNMEVEAIVHGWLEVMTSEHCPFGEPDSCTKRGQRRCTAATRYALQDEKGMVFPFTLDSFCRLHIFNSAELCLLAELPKIAPLVDVIRIEASLYSEGEVRQIVESYRLALEGVGPEKLEKRLLETLGREQFTRGHYFRGVDNPRSEGPFRRQPCLN